MNEYQNAAVQMLIGGNADASPSGEAVETTPAAETTPAEGSAGEETVNAKGEATPAPDGEAEAAPVPKNLAALAREKAELRKQKTELEQAQRETAKLMTAMRAKDPLALLAAAGFSYQQLVEQVIEGKVSSDGSEPEKAGGEKEWASRVEALEKQIQQERAGRARAEATATVRKLAAEGGDKFALVREQNAEGKVLAYLEDYYNKTGEMPAESLDESLAIAMEAVETDLNSELERWLTTSKAKAKMGSVAQPAQGTAGKAEGSGPPSKVVSTLTNKGTSSPSKHVAPPEPKTPEDYRRLALAMLEGKT